MSTKTELDEQKDRQTQSKPIVSGMNSNSEQQTGPAYRLFIYRDASAWSKKPDNWKPCFRRRVI